MSELQWGIYSLITLGGGLMALVAAAMLAHYRDDRAAFWLSWMTAAAGVWGTMTAFEFACTNLAGSLVWCKLAYLGIAIAPPFFILFSLQYARQWQPSTKMIFMLFGLPVLAIVIVFTNDWHHLHWTSATIDSVTHMVRYERGAFFPIFVTYTYVLNITSFGLLVVSTMQSQSFYVGQRVSVLVAAVFPLFANLGYLSRSTPVSNMDWTPTGFAATCVVLALGIRHQRLFDLRPTLRERMLDVMGEAVILIDAQGRVVDYNRAMAKLAPVIVDSVGVSCRELLPNQVALCDALIDGRLIYEPFRLEVRGEWRMFDASVRSLGHSGGRSRGHLVVLYDVTDEHRLAQERDALVVELGQTLARVQELGRLLPICANCKRIRDDQNLWHEVEAYFGAHSEAEMSASICPECRAKMAEAGGVPQDDGPSVAAGSV